MRRGGTANRRDMQAKIQIMQTTDFSLWQKPHGLMIAAPVLPQIRKYRILVEYEYRTGSGDGNWQRDEDHYGEEEFEFDGINAEDALSSLRSELRKQGLRLRNIISATIVGSNGRHKLSLSALKLGGLK